MTVQNELCESAFAVDGMFCGGCAATVERALRRLPGVHDVNVSFLGDSAIVRHQPAQVATPDLHACIARLGYTTRSLDDPDLAGARSHFERQLSMRLGLAIGLGMWVMMASVVRLFTAIPDALAWWAGALAGVVSLPVLLYSGWPFLRLGWHGLRQRVPGMESLILLATVASVSGSLVALSRGSSDVWFDVPVMLITFQLIARLSEYRTRRRAADTVRAMLDLSPEQARRIGTGDEGCMVPLRELCIGHTIEVRAGERIPVDGIVLAGTAMIDSALMTGESRPAATRTGDRVIAGTLDVDGVLRIRVEAAFGERRMDLLASSVGRMLNAKSDLMKLADRVAAVLVPALIVSALLALALALVQGNSWHDAFSRALAALVVSCPCALSLAVPLVVSITAASAARQGLLLRDPSALERAGRLDTILFDKTGTLTEGRPRVIRVTATPHSTATDVVRLAALAGTGSNHPLMKAIRVAASRSTDSDWHAEHADPPPVCTDEDLRETRAPAVQRPVQVLEQLEQAGGGVTARLADGATLRAGSRQWLVAQPDSPASDHFERLDSGGAGSVVWLAKDRCLLGVIELEDTLRTEARTLLDALRRQKLEIIVLSGDRPEAVQAVAGPLGVAWQAAMSPEDKAEQVRQMTEAGHVVAFIGDGLNDAPALAAAPIGIATGEASDLAKSAAAMALLDSALARVDQALQLVRLASRVLRQNLFWALIYNSLMLPAAILGHVHPVMAIVAMGLSSLSVTLNSARIGRLSTAGSRTRSL